MNRLVPPLLFCLIWMAIALALGGVLGWGAGLDEGFQRGLNEAEARQQNIVNYMVESGICDAPFMKSE